MNNIVNISNSYSSIKIPNIMSNNRNFQKMNSIKKEEIKGPIIILKN